MLKQLLAPALLLAAAASAQVAPLQVDSPWARPTVPGQPTAGAYMTFRASAPLTLLGASTPQAGTVEMHEMKMEGQVMRMRAVETVALLPGQPLRFTPGGYHFMLMDLKAPFQAGTRFPMTLRFRDAGGQVKTLELSVPVTATAPAGAQAPGAHGAHAPGAHAPGAHAH
jgi:Uncharacterized protein conserved in bacteria